MTKYGLLCDLVLGAIAGVLLHAVGGFDVWQSVGIITAVIVVR